MILDRHQAAESRASLKRAEDRERLAIRETALARALEQDQFQAGKATAAELVKAARVFEAYLLGKGR